jgi:hypothetical protein
MGSPVVPAPPCDAEGLRLYLALSETDRGAALDFARAYLPHLRAWLQARNPHVSPDLCEDAAVETLSTGTASGGAIEARRARPFTEARP